MEASPLGLSDDAWDAVKGPALSSLLLPEEPAALLEGHATDLDEAWRTVAAGIGANTSVSVDSDGRLHLGEDDALEDRASLTDLKRRLEAMMPRVDLPEQILKVMSWHPGFPAAFTSVTGGNTRLTDLDVSVAALLTAHSLSIGLSPVIDDVPALTRDRLARVDQHYLRPDNYAAANAVLINAQAEIALARAWGGGMVAAVDGVRFVVPVRSIDARPNPKYFARKKGVTWLNMISDQHVGLAGRVVSGTPKDTLHVVGLVFNPDNDRRPELLITDQGSYSDVVFGIVTLLGFDYRPVLADLPDAKLWRIYRGADYAAQNSRLVCSAMPVISLTTLSISALAVDNSVTVCAAVAAIVTAVPATDAASEAFTKISRIEAPTCSLPADIADTLRDTSSAAVDTPAAWPLVPVALAASSWPPAPACCGSCL